MMAGLMIGLMMLGLMIDIVVFTSSPPSVGGTSDRSACHVDELRVGLLIGVLVEDAAGGLTQHGSAGESG